MKHAVILSHPRGRAFTRLTAGTYVEAVRARGDEAVVRDLYEIDFDPRLQADELPGSPGGAPRADVVAERALIGDADVFAFFYPIWFGSPPAMMKGYVERVFGVGFGYRSIAHGGAEPLLSGRRMISFTSTGSENMWLVDSGSWNAVRKVFNERIATSTGLESVEHVNFGGVGAGIDPARIDEAVDQVRQTVRDVFPPLDQRNAT
jgi:NAD(P)H dehydrogenase (quinone)